MLYEKRLRYCRCPVCTEPAPPEDDQQADWDAEDYAQDEADRDNEEQPRRGGIVYYDDEDREWKRRPAR